MNPWDRLVESMGSLMDWTGAALGGSLALGIVLTTAIVRGALIPILLPLATSTRDRLVVVRRIKPEIKRLNREFRDDHKALSRSLKELHERNGIRMVDGPGLISAAIQLPILIALFQAAFLVSDRAALDSAALAMALGLAASSLAFLGTKVGGQSDGAPWLLWVSAILPFAFTLWLGTGVGLYLVGFYAAGLGQAFLMARRAPARPPPAPG